MSIFQKVTLKTLKENKTRTIVTIIGIILSLSMFTAVTVSVSSFQNYLLEVTKLREGNWHGSTTVTSADKEALLSDEAINTVSFLENIGYAIAEDCVNPEKPYLFIGGMDENADGTLPIHLTKGRLPENENELLLPAHLSYNGGVTYQLNDTITLEIGDRISEDSQGNPYILRQNTPYLYTPEDLQEQGMSDDEIAEQETEMLVPRFSHTYTVVGFYSRPSIEYYTAPGYTALTVSAESTASNGADESTASDITGESTASNGADESTVSGSTTSATEKTYTAYIRFKNPTDAVPWMDENYPDSWDGNWDLLRWSAASYESSYNTVVYGLASVLIFIILFGSISLIYNAFSISVTERTKQFGLLASLGATRKQLVHSVLFEALFLCGIGIPIGILAGITGIGITFSLLGSAISDILWDDWAIPLTLHVSPWAVIGATLLGLFTVLISAYLPARRSAKLSPMDAIRMTADITIRPGKVKTSRLTYQLFGLSGMLASKNFKRNRKKYRTTVFSLFVSVVLFISASSFCSYLMRGTENVLSDSGCDISYYRYESSNTGNISNDTILDRLSSLDSVDNAAWVQYDFSSIYVDKSAISDEYMELLTEQYPESLSENEKGQIAIDTQLFFVDDNTYHAYMKELGFSAALFGNPERPIAVAFDFFRTYDGAGERYRTLHVLDVDSTMATILKVNTPEGYSYSSSYTDENNNLTYYFSNLTNDEEGIELPAASCTTAASLTIGAVAETSPFFLGDNFYNGLLLLYPASLMEDVLGSDWAASLTDNTSCFKFLASDHKTATEDISETLQSMGLDYQTIYDNAENAAQERTLMLIITVFSYGFIILISLIAMANVFNTISTNIHLRKREFAMLKSTGMTPKGFSVMMCYECLLYGIKGLLYGLPVSILITYWIYNRINYGWETSFYIPWYSLVIAIGSVFLVVGSTMIYSMHKIGKENIMDNLKSENA